MRYGRRIYPQSDHRIAIEKRCFRISDEHGVRAEQKLYSGDFLWGSMPSMKQFLNICEYFEITPLQFFDAQENNPQLIKKALDGMRKMSDDDLIMLIGFISRLNTEN